MRDIFLPLPQVFCWPTLHWWAISPFCISSSHHLHNSLRWSREYHIEDGCSGGGMYVVLIRSALLTLSQCCLAFVSFGQCISVPQCVIIVQREFHICSIRPEFVYLCPIRLILLTAVQYQQDKREWMGINRLWIPSLIDLSGSNNGSYLRLRRILWQWVVRFIQAPVECSLGVTGCRWRQPRLRDGHIHSHFHCDVLGIASKTISGYADVSAPWRWIQSSANTWPTGLTVCLKKLSRYPLAAHLDWRGFTLCRYLGPTHVFYLVSLIQLACFGAVSG
jgi:hypothetical protein